ncbi:hypothetical protein CROQUDRAFT_660045 [Cronartium quercuum f. sp. fusiforme G11]|uniref:Succinate dehydrogenase assembly factor 3 n=1 Tax=Cronartium quercuum f. sp. fusiforme G11 TaxID=708437 RepID=A0A9P6NIU9_9BASI|nr:hypothetical protein CROQUDRAFT_660045 [Cronartium quercuum f. sp. fusiforme G11]
MRPSLRQLASSLTISPLSNASVSLLPAIPLYRRLLRIHRTALPSEMRSLGDVYVKDEFRRCRSIENPIQIIGFLGQWKIYLDTLESQSNHGTQNQKIGRQLSEATLEKLSSEQIGQLFELLKATKEIWVNNDEDESQIVKSKKTS